MIYNVIVALNLSSCFHTFLNLSQRCENALTGFIALDLFKMIAEDYCSNEGLPRGSCFVAPQTMANMQACALSVVTICVSKDPSFSPWTHGFGRMTELAIEQTFGHLRVQSRNAQLTTRGFMQADARLALRYSKTLNQQKAQAIQQGEEPLTDAESLPWVSSPVLDSNYENPLASYWFLSILIVFFGSILLYYIMFGYVWDCLGMFGVWSIFGSCHCFLERIDCPWILGSKIVVPERWHRLWVWRQDARASKMLTWRPLTARSAELRGILAMCSLMMRSLTLMRRKSRRQKKRRRTDLRTTLLRPFELNLCGWARSATQYEVKFE